MHLKLYTLTSLVYSFHFPAHIHMPLNLKPLQNNDTLSAISICMHMYPAPTKVSRPAWSIGSGVLILYGFSEVAQIWVGDSTASGISEEGQFLICHGNDFSKLQKKVHSH